MPLDTRLAMTLNAIATTALDLVAVSAPLRVARNVVLPHGTGANQADVSFSDQRTLAASATEDLDLTGTLIDAFSKAVTFARIKVLLVMAAPTNAHDVVVGGALANAFVNWVGAATDTVRVRPGGLLLLAATDAIGYPVTPDTGDALRMGNAGAGSQVVYEIVLIGTSA